MAEPKDVKNRWTREDCRDRYVRGNPISFRSLSEQANRHLSTIADWSTSDPDGNWVTQREKYQNALRLETDTKAIEQVSTRLSTELSELATEHFTINKQARELALIYLRTRSQSLKNAAEKGFDSLLAELKAVSASEVNFWSLILTRHLEQERNVTGLDYGLNLNRAASILEKEGYVILDPKSEERDDKD